MSLTSKGFLLGAGWNLQSQISPLPSPRETFSAVFEKENLSLSDLLDEENFLTEFKNSNDKLMNLYSPA